MPTWLRRASQTSARLWPGRGWGQVFLIQILSDDCDEQNMVRFVLFLFRRSPDGCHEQGESQDCPPQDWPHGGQSWGGQSWVLLVIGISHLNYNTFHPTCLILGSGYRFWVFWNDFHESNSVCINIQLVLKIYRGYINSQKGSTGP